MIDFRYHLVSIIAVFLALALGMFIGSTTLRPKVAQDLKHRVDNATARNERLSGELDDAENEVRAAEDFTNDVAPYALAGRLTAQTVVVVSLPDTDSDQRDAVLDALDSAGAIVTGDVRLREPLLDPSQDAFLTTLTERLALPGRALPESTGADRALALLAEVLGHRPQGPLVTQSAASRVVSAYATGKLLSVSGDPARAASLVVVIAAAPADADSTPSPSPTTGEDTESLLASFARYLDEAAVGAVVVGPTEAAGEGGLLAQIRSEKTVRNDVSTVDGVESTRGVIATVLALAEQREGLAGSYGGTNGVDGALPTRSPS